MADHFRPFEALLDAVADRSFNQPPALVCNAHITGLGVSRALAARGVPVIAIDRNGDGVAPYSDAVDLAGQVTYPLDDQAGFREDVEALAAQVTGEPVAFACMDEWVHAFARTRPAGVQLPFTADRIDAVLDKESLYGTAEALGIPYPETYRLRETVADGGFVEPTPEVLTAEGAAETLGFPMVIKPALKREFEEAVGTNVVEVDNIEEFFDVVDHAQEHGVRIMAQERVPVTPDEDRSYASYVPENGDPVGVVGNPLRFPSVYGTSCLVERVEAPEIQQRALDLITDTGYSGISEAEFVHDASRDEYVLLDVNTRPWKWIALPVQAGVNLPYAAYADVVGASYTPGSVRNATWVYLRDYLARLSEGEADTLSPERWMSLVSGSFEEEPGLTTGVYAPSDPAPTQQLLSTAFSNHEYYCSC